MWFLPEQGFHSAAHKTSLCSCATLSCLCLQPAHRHNLNERAFQSNTENTFFVQLSPGKCKGTDQDRQWHYLVAGLESPRKGVRWLRGRRLSLSIEPSPKSQPGQCWKEARDQLGLCIRDFRPARHRKLFLWLT